MMGVILSYALVGLFVAEFLHMTYLVLTGQD